MEKMSSEGEFVDAWKIAITFQFPFYDAAHFSS